MTLYPAGYGRRLVTLDQLRATHEPRMHPEFARRLFPFLEAQGGFMGIGGGFRTKQPDKPGFAKEGRSFHQYQDFPSGRFYAALDMVVISGPAVGALSLRKHRAPRWSEVPQQGSDTSRRFGVHMNAGTPGSKGNEPWHCQPVELDGWESWVKNGRNDLQYGYPLDGNPATPAPTGEVFMTVRRGDNNSIVAILQQKLGIHVDGQFGPKTEAAVRAFQKAHGLTVDGWVGSQTWRALA